MKTAIAALIGATFSISALPAVAESNMGEGVGAVTGGVAGYAAAKRSSTTIQSEMSWGLL